MGNPFLMIKADIRKSILSSIGILILLSFACSIGFAANAIARSTIESFSYAAGDYDLVVGAPGSRTDLVMQTVFLQCDQSLPLLSSQYLDELESDSRAEAVSPLVFADSYQGLPIVGIGEDFRAVRPSLMLQEGSWIEGIDDAIAGANVDLSIGESFSSSHEGSNSGHHENTPYTVRGKLKATGTPWDNAILVCYQSLWRVHGLGNEDNGVSAILVRPRDFASAYSLRSEYYEGNTVAVFPAEVLSSLFGMIGEVQNITETLSIFIELLVAAAAILSVLVSLPSKHHWIALLRSLGASRGYIFAVIYFQSAIIFLLSGVIGLGLGYIASAFIVSSIGSSMGMAIKLVSQAEDLIPLLIFCAIGLIGTVIPSLLGFRVSPKKVLLK